VLLNFLELLHGQQDSRQVGVVEVALADLQVVEGALDSCAIPANALRQNHGGTLRRFEWVTVTGFGHFLEHLSE